MSARPTTSSPRTWLGLAVALVVVLLLWWQQSSGEEAAEPAPDAGASSSAPTPSDSQRTSEESSDGSPGVDPASGLPVVDLAALPPEARDTLDRVDAGGPHPYSQDDSVFENREQLLPDRERGHYREYTVETPGSDDRGARRLVVGSGGEVYWTEDHYASFSRVAR